jgi:hypothetical protein
MKLSDLRLAMTVHEHRTGVAMRRLVITDMAEAVELCSELAGSMFNSGQLSRGELLEQMREGGIYVYEVHTTVSAPRPALRGGAPA